ncbi:MAG: hypothetical protein V3U79_04925 [Dehalococcoidia bacterium]
MDCSQTPRSDSSFSAGPNAFTFFSGKHSRALGSCVVYEYDFHKSALGAYQPSIRLP